MSHILFKQVPNSTISASTIGNIKVFSNSDDSGSLYYVNSDGLSRPIGEYNEIKIENKTYAQLHSMYLAGSFATGSYYIITDYDSVYEQPDFYCDGTPKTVVSIKGKPAIPYQPILVRAISGSNLDVDAYQPYYPNDKIKYDISWNKTEFNRNAKGRITERIDEYGNKTDFDHRTIRFKRYKEYTRGSLISGSVTDYNCVTGKVLGSGFTGLTDILLVDTLSVLGYNIGFKIITVNNDGDMDVLVDSLYSSGIPSNVSLLNGTSIIPVDYSFTGLFDAYVGVDTGNYTMCNEVYFGQSDESDFDEEVYPFAFAYELLSYGHVTSVNNTFGNYSNLYKKGESNNTFILCNNVFGDGFYNNKFGNYCFNNNILSDFTYNNIGDLFSYNYIKSGFAYNIISYGFKSNIILSNFTNNNISNSFYLNKISSGFKYNSIKTIVSGVDFSPATYVYANFSCEIFKNSGGNNRLLYYDDNDVANISDIDS